MHWFNHGRLLEPIGNIPPAEAEARHYAQTKGLAMVVWLRPPASWVALRRGFGTSSYLSSSAAIVTKDEDFAQRKALTANRPVVVWVRLPNTRGAICLNGLRKFCRISCLRGNEARRWLKSHEDGGPAYRSE